MCHRAAVALFLSVLAYDVQGQEAYSQHHAVSLSGIVSIEEREGPNGFIDYVCVLKLPTEIELAVRLVEAGTMIETTVAGKEVHLYTAPGRRELECDESEMGYVTGYLQPATSIRHVRTLIMQVEQEY